VALFVGGMVLRWYSIIHLGRFFTVNVAIAADHQLVETGPYRFVRHPSYTGALLAFIGFAIVLRNWASVLVISLPIAFAFLYRINVEERALVQALGERYSLGLLGAYARSRHSAGGSCAPSRDARKIAAKPLRKHRARSARSTNTNGLSQNTS
jgi:hypothetical protein